ncbi:MAG: MBOAT family protein [Candidatus Helarchaeota archaeon]|nr:MBOAT family protein [Candidatus Helarchaeota archaeon]
MLFNSLEFLIFIPVFLVCYLTARGQIRLWICLVFSAIFYGWWDWRLLGILWFCTLVGYFIGLSLDRATDPRKRRLLLILGTAINLGLLGIFKYTNFSINSLVMAFGKLGIHIDIEPLRIILPVGISFFTFRNISYLVDVYRREIPVESSLLGFANFLTLFPLVLAGPITRGGPLLSGLRDNQQIHWNRFLEGASLVFWGYFKKVVIADSLALIVDSRFAHPEAHTSLSLLIGVLFYSFQIYCDFSGYSDIAIGIGRILGLDFGINFDRPYFSSSFSEFWRRWHISLSSWLRDYLYIPLGGNRYGRFNTYRNLGVTMLLGGLWHGAQWNFVIWGALHGLFLVFQHTYAWIGVRLGAPLLLPKWLIMVIGTIVVFCSASVAWIFFRAQTFEGAVSVIRGIISFDNMNFEEVPNRFLVVKGLILIGLLFGIEALSFRISFYDLLRRRPILRLVAGAAILWSLALFGSFTGNTFIYFQF